MTEQLRSALKPFVAPLGGAEGLQAELTLRLPSDVVVIEDAVAVVAEHVEATFRDLHEVRFNLRVALCEALANAMLYGNGGDPDKTVDLCARYGPTTIEVEVTDQGEGFDPDAVPDPTLPENLFKSDGRGVFLIRRLMDEVRFNEKGNSICMILRRG